MAGLTAREMEYEAKVIYEALASADAPGYTSRQWSIILTQAQEKVVTEIINEGWDKNETNRRSIAALLQSTSTSASSRIQPTDIWDNAWRVSLPIDYMHIVSDRANGNIRVVPKAYDYVMANIDNPFEKPYQKEFWRTADGKNIIVITDGTRLESYRIVYIKRPEPIITKELARSTAIEGFTEPRNCQLDPIVHRRIVDRAGRLAEAYVNNQLGYQISTIEEQSTK